MGIELSKAIEIFTKKAQQMTATQAFDPGDIADALRNIGIVDQSSLKFADSALQGLDGVPGVWLEVTLQPNGSVNVQLGEIFKDPAYATEILGFRARKIFSQINADKIKKAVENHFKNKGLILPNQPVTVTIPS